MEIEIHLTNGRVVRTTLPVGATVSSDQLAVLTGWAIAGKSADILVD